MSWQDPLASADDFLATGSLFQLGFLPTEQPHPDSLLLDRLAREQPEAALRCLQGIDIRAFAAIDGALDRVGQLAEDIHSTLQAGGRVFLAGCGATGRLALSLESWVRAGAFPAVDRDRVIAFMAGGDAALVRSLEGFEDHPEFGARQLLDLGFGPKDRLIAVTEGGETPFVIGAAEAAAEMALQPVWFLFCNPVDALMLIDRSRRVLTHQRIRALPLITGPQAVAGSTRMQASTVLLTALWLAFKSLPDSSEVQIRKAWLRLRERLCSHSYECLAPFVLAESSAYEQGDCLLYCSDQRSALTVLTDTTERAPTFSLVPFENLLSPSDPLSLCYLMVPGTRDAEVAWCQLLGRPPRTVEWPQVEARSGLRRLLGFDISANAEMRRSEVLNPARSLPFVVRCADNGISWSFGDCKLELPTLGWSVGEQQILLKVLLNAHSTSIMGRLGRYDGNCMTWVQASNGKLIDRAARTVQWLYRTRKGREADYAAAVRAVFACRQNLQPDQPVVLPALKMLMETEQ